MLERKKTHMLTEKLETQQAFISLCFVACAFLLLITCTVHSTMLVYNTPALGRWKINLMDLHQTLNNASNFFSLEQKEHDNMVSQTTSGCQQGKLQSQGTFQAQCVRFINSTKKYQ